jgi:hypothetical protein
MIKGHAKFDGLAIGEFTAIFIGPTLDFKAKAAFIDTTTGQTHGWTSNQTWSRAVVEKLHELKQLMEIDLGALHLEAGGEPPRDAVAAQPGSAHTGLGEYVGDAGVDQV